MAGKMLSYYCILLFVFIFISQSTATHFRYGTLSWVQSTTQDRQFTFTLKAAFRYSYFTEQGLYYKIGNTINHGYFSFDYKYTECFIFCWTSSDTEIFDTVFVINNIDVPSDWMTVTMIKGFVADSDIFWLKGYYSDGNRLSTLVNNANGLWNLESVLPIKDGVKSQVSPVSALLPVIPFNKLDPQPFAIPGTDATNAKLTWSLASSTVMKGSQPTGFSVNSNTGIATFAPTQNGVFSAQVLISKTFPSGLTSYIPVDFLINVTSTPPAQPPYYIPPTPTTGSTYQIGARLASTIPLVGYTPMAGRTVDISIGDLPTGVIRDPQTASGQTSTVNLRWTPDTSQVGTYIINLALKDNMQVSMLGGTQYFFLQVTMPQCGNGVPNNGICVCDAGWTGPKCDQCLPDRYGPNCLPLPTCINGTSSNGTTGTGFCTCNQGWSGPACNITIVQRCSLSNPSVVLTQQIALGAQLLQPFGSQVYLSEGPLNSVNFGSFLNQPPQIPIDIYFVFDTTASASLLSNYNLVKTQFQTLVNNLVSVRQVVKYGVGIFSDSTASTNPFVLRSYLKTGTDIMATINSLSITSGDPIASLPYVALTNGIPYMVWSGSTSIKTIILVTDNNLASSTQSINDLKAQLTSYNILLGIFSYNSASNHAWLDGTNLGLSFTWNPASNWFTQLSSNINTLSQTYNLFVSSDVSGLVSTAPARTSITTAFTNFTTVLKYPVSPITATNPTVTLRSPGFGHQVINVQFNHKPSTSSFSINVNENTGTPTSTSFSFSATDIDFNILSVSFQTLPTLGTLTYKGGSVTAGNPILPLATTKDFTFTPGLFKYGTEQITFAISDGCLYTTATLTIVVNMVNIQPTCKNVQITSDQFNQTSFTLSGTELNGLALKLGLSASISNLGSIGAILYNGSPASASTSYASPSNFTFAPLATALNGVYSTQFTVVNPAQLSSICTLTITINRIYLPPTLTIGTQQSMTPLTTKTIPFTINSFEQILKVNITQISPASGTFYDSNNQAINSAPYQFGTYNLSGIYSASSNIYYSAINDIEPNIGFTIQVADYFGGFDTKTVQITVSGPRVNHPPSAFQVPIINLMEDSNSTVFYLNGTDPDQPRYDNNLNVILVSSPRSGTLYNGNGTPINSFNFAPLGLIYSPNTGFYGTDSLIFTLEDSLGASSDQVTIVFNVTHVNHKPTITTPNLALYGQTGGSTPTQAFTIVPLDVDVGDALTVTVLTVPSIGTLTVAGSQTAITAQTIISTFDLTYTIPKTIEYDFTSSYSVRVCDNYNPPECFTSTGQVTFNFTTIHPPPTCQSISYSTDQLTPITFNLTGQDQDSAPGTVLVSLSALDSLLSGSLLYNGQPIQSTDQLPIPALVTFRPLATTDSASSQLPFTIYNQFGMTTQCTLTIAVNRVAVPPTLQLADSITISPDTRKIIPFSITDLDFNEVLNVIVVSAIPVNGSFSDQNNVTINTPNQGLGSFDVSATHSADSYFVYNAMNLQYTGVSITLMVIDSTGRNDSKTLNIIVSGDLVSYPPVANPVGPIVTDQNSDSGKYVITGSHPNMPGYNGKLSVVIAFPPARGSVVASGDQTTPFEFLFRPTVNVYGVDSFQYYVVDDNGIASNTIIVNVTINKVNYPPIIDFNPPTIVGTGSCEVSPNRVPFNLTVVIINEVDYYNITITRLPSRGTFFFQGTQIKSAPFPLPVDQLEGTLEYLPSSQKLAYTDTYDITSCTNLVCGLTNGHILYDYEYSVPNGYPLVVSSLQDVPVSFSLNGTVCEKENVIYQLQTLPTFGFLVDSTGNNITSTSVNITVPSLTYVPLPGVYGQPIETIYYQVVSLHDLVSVAVPIEFNVEQVIFPKYDGPLNFTTYENVSLDLIFKESDVKGSTIQIISYTKRGKLIYHFNSSYDINIPSNGLQEGGFSPYEFKYTPPPGEFGTALDSFQFVLAQRFTSVVYTVYIDVLQVFVPPVLSPLTYRNDEEVFQLTNFVAQVFTNGQSVITWNVTSEDLPWSTLTSNISVPTADKGMFFQYVDGVKGGQITRLQQVQRSSNGLWSILYITPNNRSGKKLATCMVYAIDEKQLISSKNLYIDVIAKNTPPTVYLNQTVVRGNTGISTLFNNISVYDKEAILGNSNVTFTVNLTDSTGQLASSSDASIQMMYILQSSCNVSTNQVICNNNIQMLNRFLSSVSAVFTKGGNYTLTVYVNDLGYISTLGTYNSQYALSDLKSVTILVGSYSSGKDNKTTVISAAIAAAAVAAAIVAIGVWRVLKARAPPTDAFFGDSPFADGTVSSNPLYQSNPNSSMNPLYEDTVN